ncbi:MAG: MarR family winged helix-turn-helix transcriptional regulator [Actinomycetota bacterium]|nr:MarR family winged helix-turn-helix transcriptional regulator [Actinomycetota bacterium]
MTQPLSDRSYQSLAHFRHALRVFERFSEDAARAAGITPAQHQLLLVIRGHLGPDAPSVSDVAARLQLKLHSAGELVGRAEARGLVDRWADPVDLRRALLTLTPMGEAKLAELSVLHRRELRRFRREMNDVLRELDD